MLLRKLYRTLLLLTTLSAIALVLLAFTPVGPAVEGGINAHLDGVNDRMHAGRLTWLDRVECRLLYKGIVVAGWVVSPEGSQIVNWYINGDGSDYELSPDYIKTSPVVQRHLATMRVGETRVVRFKQNEDWRLSYALNPFRIKRERDRVLVWQEIVFLKRRDVYTDLNLGVMRIRLRDGLIHALNPKKFTVRSAWGV
jgi:hypothetical protein